MTTEKNAGAVALGKLRAKTLTTEHQSTAGKARAAKLSPERRSEIARKAAAKSAKIRAKSKKSCRRKSSNGKDFGHNPKI
jgi:hypothetical protein